MLYQISVPEIRSLQNRLSLLHTSLCHSDPRLTLATLTATDPNLAVASTSIIPHLLALSDLILSISPADLSLWTDESLHACYHDLAPFFVGEKAARSVSKSGGMGGVDWWQCPGAGEGHVGMPCEVTGEEDLHACMRVRSFC